VSPPALAQKLPPEKAASDSPFFGPLPAFDCGSLEPQPIGDGMTMQVVQAPFMHETSVLPNQGKTESLPQGDVGGTMAGVHDDHPAHQAAVSCPLDK
jgi:hypothetical protein